MTDKKKVEAVAAVIARECYPWTPDFKKKLAWPKDLTPEERSHCRSVATRIVQTLFTERRP